MILSIVAGFGYFLLHSKAPSKPATQDLLPQAVQEESCPTCLEPSGKPVFAFVGAYSDRSCTKPLVKVSFSACTILSFPQAGTKMRVMLAEPLAKAKKDPASGDAELEIGQRHLGEVYLRRGGACKIAEDLARQTPATCSNGKRVCRSEGGGSNDLTCTTCARGVDNCPTFVGTEAYLNASVPAH